MNIPEFLNKIEEVSKHQPDVRLYHYENGEKLYTRFLSRIFTLNNDVIQTVKTGWLREIYSRTNGIDLKNFYLVPFNNYFNKKEYSFDSFSWYTASSNPNEIAVDFFPFMTDGKTIIGFYAGNGYGTIKDSKGNLLIAIAKKKKKIITDLTFIASNIYVFLNYIVNQLELAKQLTFTDDVAYWYALDGELKMLYESGRITEHKLKYMWQYDSENYKLHTKLAT